MKVLFDANLAPELARRLEDMFPGSVHVEMIGLGAQTPRYGVMPRLMASLS